MTITLATIVADDGLDDLELLAIYPGQQLTHIPLSIR